MQTQVCVGVVKMSRDIPRTLTFAVALVVVISLYYTFVSKNGGTYNTIFRLQDDFRSKVTQGLRTKNLTKTPIQGWILHFNNEPHPDSLQTLLHFYAKHFMSVVIVSPTGRIGKLLELNMSGAGAEVIWAQPCDIRLNGGHVGGLMMRCYTEGLKLLQKSANFQKVEYVVLSNDDVILNMTKVREFARKRRPVSHAELKDDAPLMFAQPPPWNDSNIPYFKGWSFAPAWAQCQQVFSKVPPQFKQRFLETQGSDKALVGGCDVLFLPSEVVPEFVFLSTVVSECWPEIGVPSALAMLSSPVKFYIPPSEVFMYRWWGIVITPQMFEQELANHSIVSFHPFKLSYPEHRTALAHFMTKYKFSD